MDIFESKYYRQSKYLLTLIGQWPYSNWKVRLFVRIFFIGYGISFIGIQIYQFTCCGFTFEVAMKVATPLVSAILVYTRYIHHWLNMNVIKKLLEYIRGDWDTLKSEDEARVLEKYADRGRVYGTYYTYCATVVICIFLLIPLTPKILDVVVPLNESRPRLHFYEAEYFFDPEKYYYLILLYSGVAFFGGLLIVAGADLTLLTCVMHACGSFSVTGYYFEHMYDCDDGDLDDARRSEAVCEKIANSINRHRRATEYLQTMVSCYAAFLVVQLFFAVVSLTVFLFQIADGLKSPDKTTETITAIGNAVFDWCSMFAYVYPAQQIFDCSSELFYKAFNGRWYTAPLKVQKMLVPILRKTAEPCGMSVFGFLAASMETFALIIRTSLSYFTFLCTVRE